MKLAKAIASNRVSFRTVSIEILHLAGDNSTTGEKHTLVFFHAFMEDDSACNYAIQEIIFSESTDDETRSFLASLYALQECLIFLESMDITLNIPDGAIISKLQRVLSQQPDFESTHDQINQEEYTRMYGDWERLIRISSVFKLLGAYINIQGRDTRSAEVLQNYRRIASLYMCS
ncbi:hypothetical protein TWF788_003242 [Orbilia oligospora]|uniref:Uncharacterized protein n=1 Tax=Orbilia oligospora TaxID=2813651 RepID=A0A7C8U3L8_ORBOL|nr:hypothetical protein TWF788_003242 [Orbilia oligospora]